MHRDEGRVEEEGLAAVAFVAFKAGDALAGEGAGEVVLGRNAPGPAQ